MSYALLLNPAIICITAPVYHADNREIYQLREVLGRKLACHFLKSIPYWFAPVFLPLWLMISSHLIGSCKINYRLNSREDLHLCDKPFLALKIIFKKLWNAEKYLLIFVLLLIWARVKYGTCKLLFKRSGHMQNRVRERNLVPDWLLDGMPRNSVM